MRIGIRVADGSFFPILEDQESGHKKLVVTTVRDNQAAVRIALYREDSGLAEGTYLGTLDLGDIEPAPKGEPDVEMLLGIDDDSLNVMARDVRTGDSHSISVSLESREDDFDIPESDFEAHPGVDEELDPDQEPTVDDLVDSEPEYSSDVAVKEEFGILPDFPDESELSPGEENDFSDAEIDQAADEEPDTDPAALTGLAYPVGSRDSRRESLEQQRRRNPALLIGFVVLGLVITGAVAYLIYRAIAGPTLPPLAADALAAMHGARALPTVAATTTPIITPLVPTPQPVQETLTPAAIPSPAGTVRGLWYTLRWGDTLWDLAGTFYRNPWWYPVLASANDIPNPDVIYASSQLFIPDWE